MSQTAGIADHRTSKSRGTSPVVIGVGAFTFVGAVLSSSPLIVLISGSTLILIIAVLWRANEPPILLVPALLQFAAVGVKPLISVFTGRSLEDLADYDAVLAPAVLFGFSAIAALVVGIRIGVGTAPLTVNGEDWPYRKMLAVALGAIMLGHVLDVVAERSGGASQILLHLGEVKWVGLFILAYWTLRRRYGLHWLVLAVAVEIVLGMIGFFSEFRMVLFVLFGAALAAFRKLRARGLITLTIAAALTLLLAVFWSSVKVGYRSFLNRGSGEQVALQPVDERLSYLASEAAGFNKASFDTGLERLLARVSYIDFLAVVMERVPQVLPHEGGAHVGAAILHVLTPRMLFPDKAELPSDTSATAYYTNLPIAVFANANTSISIGYLGELYIDFGIIGGLVAVFLMGVAFGRCYREIRDFRRTPPVANYALCMMIALGFASFETALIKLIGGLAMVVVVAFVLQRIVLPVLPFSASVNFGRPSKANNL